MKTTDCRKREEDLHTVSDAVLTTMNNLKRTGISLLKKVPDLYYDPTEDNSSKGMFSPRMIHPWNKRSHSRSDVASAYSTSCTSTSEGEVSESNSTITTRPSMMAIPNTSILSFGIASTEATVEPNTPHSMGRPMIMTHQDWCGRPHEVVFEAATRFDLAKVIVEDESLEDDVEKNTLEVVSIDEDYNDDRDSVRTRRLSLMWDEAQAVARRGKNLDLGHLPHARGESPAAFQLPGGITKDDIMVTIDIDDTARSSLFCSTWWEKEQEPPTHRCNTDTISNISSCHRSRQESHGSSPTFDCSRYDFEQGVQQVILDDLKSIYTATTDTAKLVLCIVICILSDGSMQHTSRVGGRMGLAELALNWRLFGADDLKLYEGGLTVQRKDFGFGPLELTEAEGEYYMMNQMAPRAACDIVRRIGGSNQDFLAEI
ncbi:hypothetical protein IV203_020937 [Nitzschia inconspicua]|uniref:Uncharacterized protein n=1 Tax=Nitzschia inconspicua TaxID=303405 RepID=A0A9K3KFZ8_9STRA|nr:hypothetical protein IV203_020937 [Nitzschia inconspicua]